MWVTWTGRPFSSSTVASLTDRKDHAELNKLIRNVGDKIVAVNGVKVMSYHQLIAVIQESKNNPVTICVSKRITKRLPFESFSFMSKV